MTLKTSRKKSGKSLKMKVSELKRVKNFVVKGEIAHYKQFLLLTHCFQKSSAADVSESICRWERVKLSLYQVKEYQSGEQIFYDFWASVLFSHSHINQRCCSTQKPITIQFIYHWMKMMPFPEIG